MWDLYLHSQRSARVVGNVLRVLASHWRVLCLNEHVLALDVLLLHCTAAKDGGMCMDAMDC